MSSRTCGWPGVAVLLALAVGLAIAGCSSSGGKWQPFSLACAVLDKQTVAAPMATADGPRRPDRHVLYLACGRQVLSGEVDSPLFFASVKQGDCVLASGEHRGGVARRIALAFPCPKPAAPVKGANA